MKEAGHKKITGQGLRLGRVNANKGLHIPNVQQLVRHPSRSQQRRLNLSIDLQTARILEVTSLVRSGGLQKYSKATSHHFEGSTFSVDIGRTVSGTT